MCGGKGLKMGFWQSEPAVGGRGQTVVETGADRKVASNAWICGRSDIHNGCDGWAGFASPVEKGVETSPSAIARSAKRAVRWQATAARVAGARRGWVSRAGNVPPAATWTAVWAAGAGEFLRASVTRGCLTTALEPDEASL